MSKTLSFNLSFSESSKSKGYVGANQKNNMTRRNCCNVNSAVGCLISLVVIVSVVQVSNACDQKFEGFGVFLGSNAHFSRSQPGIEAKVIQVVYEFLGVRLFRTSYEENFSPEPDKYEITCEDENTRSFTCSWINVHRYISNLTGVQVFASVWSPPHYMKNKFYQLMPEYETEYFYFIKNMTELMKQDYNITIEKVSPVNEPENVFAPWDHTNMSPDQLCRIIRNYNDPLISICPENSYFWISKIYYDFDSGDPELNCSSYCDVHATHAYSLNLDFSSENSLLAYYDMKPYSNRGTTGPIWMTEVSSTYKNADSNQMTEALDLATNIINFLGISCIQRYYFWYAYTLNYSGESLIWGDDEGNLFFPKKFFVYKLFINASNTIDGPVDVNVCDSNLPNPFVDGMARTATLVENVGCLQFGDRDRVLVNKEVDATELPDLQCSLLCCTTETDDFSCSDLNSTSTTVPARSVCHCLLNTPAVLNNSIVL